MGEADERRRERILRICNELQDDVPKWTLDPIREYAEGIYYCEDCGHERGQHGNGIVDRRCLADGCPCPNFEVEDLLPGAVPG